MPPAAQAPPCTGAFTATPATVHGQSPRYAADARRRSPRSLNASCKSTRSHPLLLPQSCSSLAHSMPPARALAPIPFFCRNLAALTRRCLWYSLMCLWKRLLQSHLSRPCCGRSFCVSMVTIMWSSLDIVKAARWFGTVGVGVEALSWLSFPCSRWLSSILSGSLVGFFSVSSSWMTPTPAPSMPMGSRCASQSGGRTKPTYRACIFVHISHYNSVLS